MVRLIFVAVYFISLEPGGAPGDFDPAGLLPLRWGYDPIRTASLITTGRLLPFGSLLFQGGASRRPRRRTGPLYAHLACLRSD